MVEPISLAEAAVYVGILALGLIAGLIGGVIGFGSSIIMMPALVLTWGPAHAVPVMAIAALFANLSRIMVWWREIDWRAVAAYSITVVPSAALGARTLLELPPRWVELGLGVFFLTMIWCRRALARAQVKLGLGHLAIIGAVVGFLTGIVVSTGPITAPVFLMYGLSKGAFLATEAAGSLAAYGAKATVFRAYGALPNSVAIQGLIVGAALMLGGILAKRVVQRFEAEQFRRLIDWMIALSGILMIGAALRG